MLENDTIYKTLNSITPFWENLKAVLDKYPNAFQLKYDKEKGYCLLIDLDSVIQNQDNPTP